MDGEESSEGTDDEVVESAGDGQEEPAASSASDAPDDDAERPAAESADADEGPEPESEDDATADSGIEGPAQSADAGDDDRSDGGGNEVDDADESADEDDAERTEPDDDSPEADASDEDHGPEEDDAVGKFRGNPALEGRTGPEDDREMPLTEHVEEMLKRLAVVIAVAGLVSLIVFPFADQVINFLWYSIMPGVPSEIARPRVYGILEKLFTELKVASLAGLIVALPVLVYETYAFMRPGLYPHERRYYLAAIPTSLVLAIVGASFAYFIVLPAIFTYFLYYSQDVATIGFALGRTFDLILLMMGYLAIVFQIPLFIMLAMMMGLVTRRWLADRRLLFWGAFLGISFLFGFDPTGMAPILVAATMIVLFEGTLLLTKWTGRE